METDENPFQAPVTPVDDASNRVPARTVGEAVSEGVRMAFMVGKFVIFPLIGLGWLFTAYHAFTMFMQPFVLPGHREETVRLFALESVKLLVLCVGASILLAILGVVVGVFGFWMGKPRVQRTS